MTELITEKYAVLSDCTLDQALSELHSLYNAEEAQFNPDTCAGQTTKIEAKGISTEVLTGILKDAFSRPTLVNNSMLVNVNILVNGYNTLDDALFESEDIYFSDLEQLLDVKLALKPEIEKFQTELSFWYLACLKSMHKVEYTYLDKTEKLPNVFKKFMISSNMLTMSQILARAKNIQTSDLPLVENAFPVISELAATTALANRLLESINFSQVEGCNC